LPDGYEWKIHSDKATAFYRAGLWHFGLAVVRILPVGLVKGFCLMVAEIYYRLQREQREMVVANFLPVLDGDHAAAEKAAHRLFRKFSTKLVDLWRVESGVPVSEWLTHSPNWTSFAPPVNADAACCSSRCISVTGNTVVCS